MAKQVEFFFDYGSPFSYLANTRMAGLAQRTGAEIIYKPALLGAIFKTTGNVSPVAIAAKSKYTLTDLMRWSARYGVPFRMNPFFPINTLRLMRGAIMAQSARCFPAYHETTFRAMWAEGLNLGDESVFGEILARFAIDRAALEREEVKARLRANTEEAIRRGAFGVPTFFVGDDIFFGNDRLDFVEQALRERA
jgi:2-hydroxychromene-2-carboxylate isomerase